MRLIGVRAGLVLAAALTVGAAAALGQAGDMMGGGQDAPAVAMGRGQMVRGTVTAVAGDKLTVKTETGDVYQVVTTANTRVMKGRDAAKFGDIHAGDGVGAMGEVDAPNKTVHALMLAVVDAAEVKKAKESFGKTWIAGKVTGIDEVKITVMRSDNVSQVVMVDEETSFRRGGRAMQMASGNAGGMGGMMGGGGGGRGGGAAPAGGNGPGGGRGNGGAAGGGGGESITLADVKVGDAMAATGALKGGVFTATQFGVGDPTAQGNRRRRNEGAQPAQEPK